MTNLTNAQLYIRIVDEPAGSPDYAELRAEALRRGFQTLDELAESRAGNYGLAATEEEYLAALAASQPCDLLAEARSLVQQAKLLTEAAGGKFSVRTTLTIHEKQDGRGIAELVIDAVAQAYGLRPEEITGPRRLKEISIARIMSFALIAARLTDYSDTQVVADYLNRERTVAYYYAAQHSHLMAVDAAYKSTFTSLLAGL